jgi:hypothetical protein
MLEIDTHFIPNVLEAASLNNVLLHRSLLLVQVVDQYEVQAANHARLYTVLVGLHSPCSSPTSQ